MKWEGHGFLIYRELTTVHISLKPTQIKHMHLKK